MQVGRRRLEVGRIEEEQAATALGHVAHCVALLAAYLDVPLRYPVQPYGSYSFLRDLEAPRSATGARGSVSARPRRERHTHKSRTT